MAIFSAILTPSDTTAIKVAALATTTISSEQALGTNVVFAINADQDITIKFGIAGMAAAATTDFRIPQNQTFTFFTGRNFDRIRVFNQSGSTAANVYIQPLTVLR